MSLIGDLVGGSIGIFKVSLAFFGGIDLWESDNTRYD